MVEKSNKAERMELRRANGTRKVHGVSAPQVVPKPSYVVAHACFHCRKSWKIEPRDGSTCPQCEAVLCEMGRSFKVPRQKDIEQWQKVQLLWNAGFRFWSYRSHPGAEALPERLRDVPSFIERNAEHPMRHIRVAASQS